MILWLTIQEHDGAPARCKVSHLLRKEVPTDGTPGVGDMISELWQGGPDASIAHRYWDHEGRLNVELQPITWLPNDLGEEWIAQGRRHGETDFYYPTPWREHDEALTDGGLLAELRRVGWSDYQPAEYHP